MEPDVSSLIDIYQFPTGHRLFALAKLREVIAGEAEASLLARVDAAIAFDQETHALELRYHGQESAAEHAPEAPGVDQQIDRVLTALYDGLAHNERAFPADEPIHTASVLVRKALLPRGPGAISQLTYLEETEAVATLVRTAVKAAIAPQIDIANARPHITRLATLNAQFKDLVGVGQAGAVGFDKVRAARAIGQRNLAKIVAWILGHYLDDDAPQLAARERLLGPILKQNASIGAEHARTGVVTDVDPVTGDPAGPSA